MKALSIISLLSASLLLTGCYGSSLKPQMPFKPSAADKFVVVVDTQGPVPPEVVNTLDTALATSLSREGLLAPSPAKATRAVSITVTSYRMRSNVMRFLFGLFAGTDHIDSTVRVADRRTKASLGQFDVVSKNQTSYASTEMLLADHVNRIVKYLKKGQT